MNEWRGENRRKSPRIHYPCLIVLEDENTEKAPIMVEAENISSGGIAVTAKKKIEMDSIVNVTLDLGLEDPIKFTGKVVWSLQREARAEQKPCFFDTGISFLDISDDSLKRIETVVGSLKDKKNKAFLVVRKPFSQDVVENDKNRKND